MKAIRANVKGRSGTTVRLVNSKKALPATARYMGTCSYRGRCAQVWRNEGRYYALAQEISQIRS